MKNFILFFTLFFTVASAQNDLVFNKSFIEAENNWVAFPKNADGDYPYGFIYIDLQAGLTLEFGGKFKIDAAGKLINEKDSKNSSLKIRLQANNVKVAIIPKEKLLALNLDPKPDWLKSYKIDTTSSRNLFRLGYLYNEYGDCAKAGTYLEKVQKIDAKFDGLKPELAFSYNCLKQFDKAIAILKDDIVENPSDDYVHKELSYAYLKNGDVLNAEKTFYKCIQNCSNQNYLGETSYNILSYYYQLKDAANFKIWLSTAKKYSAGNTDLLAAIKSLEDTFLK